MKQRTYIDGTLTKTTKATEPAILRRWLDNMERDWSKHLSPLTLPGEFDANNGHKVTRVSPDELLVITTGNRRLRFVNIG